MEEPERDYLGNIICHCAACDWCKSLEDSAGRTIYFCMNADSTDPKVKAYVDAYKEYADGKVPENMSAQTYENVQMVMQAIENVGSTDREAIKDELYNMTFEGITGTLSYDEVGDAVKTQVWYVVKDGKFVESDQKLQLWDDFEASLQ